MPNRSANSTPAPARIVIVDDHKILRDGLRRLLGDQSDLVVVGEAPDSETAWRLAGDCDFEIRLSCRSLADLK